MAKADVKARSAADRPTTKTRRRGGRRRLVVILIVGFVIITATGLGVGHHLAQQKIAEMVGQIAAARGFTAEWTDVDLGLDGEIALSNVRFESTRTGMVEGEVARVSTHVTLDDIWHRQRPTEFLLEGLRLRADTAGVRALTEPGAPSGERTSEAAPLTVRFENFDLMFQSDPDRAVACHIANLQAQRAGQIELRGRMDCRVPSLGLATGAFEATAIYDSQLGDEPLQVVIESFGDVSASSVGARFERLTASIGRLGGRLEVTELGLSPAELDGDWPVTPSDVAIESLVVNFSRSDTGWSIDRLAAGPGLVQLETGHAIAAELATELPPAQVDEDGRPDDAEDRAHAAEDENMLALEEASRDATSSGPPTVDWNAVEQDLNRVADILDDALSLSAGLASRVEVTDFGFALAGPSGRVVELSLRHLTAEPTSASAMAVFADHELTFTMQRLPAPAEERGEREEEPDDGSEPEANEEADAEHGGLELTLVAERVDLERVSEAIGRPDVFQGHIDVQFTVRTGESLSADLDIGLPDFVVNHGGISPEPVALLPVELQTNLRFTPDRRRRLSFDIEGTLGDEIRGEASATITMRNEYPQLDVAFHVDEADCRDMLAAVPEGLFTHFGRDRMRVDGRAGVDGQLRYRFGDFRSFRVTFGETFPGTCAITRLPRAVRPDALATDTYRHRVPEIYLSEDAEEIWVGPGTDSYIPLDELPPFVPPIMYFTEQRNFYEDPAISISLISKAVRVNLIYDRWAYGGSTITQQLVKNLFFDRGKTLARKLQEAIISWAVFTTISRDRILELYVNCIEFGPDVWGIEAAAQFYFGISARDLEPAQAVYLAGLKPSPRSGGSHRRRGQSPSRTRWRHRIRDRLQELADAGYIEQSYVDAQAPYIVEFADPVEPTEPDYPNIVPID